jgi:FMN-dependent oxidoreductase (nitrilotriacetate monooxygenase family)
MSVAPLQIKLGMFLRQTGHHIAAWRLPDVAEDSGINFARSAQVAEIAERGLFDLIFSADNVALPHDDATALEYVSDAAWIEPYTLMAALAPVTRNIGLICTATTTYDEPYFIARKFASLDLVSGGRAGWNVVTSGVPTEAANFGRHFHPEKSDRYRRAREFVEVVRGLWDSWDDDAFLRDKASGKFFDSNRLHVLNHAGAQFKVRGPLNVARSPQGQPVVVQAGSSDDGMEVAAETAEVVFTAQPDIENARRFYAEIRRRMAKYGRDPREIVIMPGFLAMVGRSQQEAQDKFERLQQLIHPKMGLTLLTKYMGYDLTGCNIDDPLPEPPPGAHLNSRTVILTKTARAENLTVRQLYERVAGSRGHCQVCGTASQIADAMEEWFTSGAADGFNVMPPYLPGALEDFVELVVPELQRRGLFRTRYEGKTLRENLGLPRPLSRYRTGAPERPGDPGILAWPDQPHDRAPATPAAQR